MAFRFLESEANDLARQSGVPTVLEPGVRLNRHRDAEQYSVVHFPGPGLDWQVFAPGIRLLTSVRAHPDFAGIGALAFSDWTNANPDEQGKAILLKQGYFYGWGGSCQAAGKLMMGPLHLGGELFYGRYYSQDGLERQPEKLTVDVPAEAQVLFYRGSLAMQPTRFPLAVGLSVMARRWSSTVGGQSRTVRLMSRGLYASVWF